MKSSPKRFKIIHPKCGAPWFHGSPESPQLDANPRRDEGEARAGYYSFQKIKHGQPLMIKAYRVDIK